MGTTIIVTYSTTATSNSPAGTYPITATVTGSSAKNYQVVVNAGTLTITAATQPVLTVTANNATRVYGAANPTFSGTVTGAQNGDTFTESFTTTATTTSNGGQLCDCALGDRYKPGQLHGRHIVNGTLTVTGSGDHDHIDCAGQRCLRRQRNPDGDGDLHRRHAWGNRNLL